MFGEIPTLMNITILKATITLDGLCKQISEETLLKKRISGLTCPPFIIIEKISTNVGKYFSHF